MAAVALGTKAIGSMVKITVNGTARNFIVAHKGKPSSAYDDSFNASVILVMEDLYLNRNWHRTNVNDYANSDVAYYLNNTFFNLIDATVRSNIKQVKIPYRPGSGTSTYVSGGANGLLAKIFLLSMMEVGSSTARSYMPLEGAKLDYFDFDVPSGNTFLPSPKRIAYLNGDAFYWSLRTPLSIDSLGVWYVSTNGTFSYVNCTNARGIRPALVLPDDIFVSDDGSVIAERPPTTPASLTIPETIRGGTIIAVSWDASTDPQNALSGYKVEKSTNGGSTWSQIYQGPSTSTTDNVTYGTVSVMYRVKAYNNYSLESEYRTGSQVTVVNNVAPTAPSSIMIPVEVVGGKNIVISWGSSTSTTSTIQGYMLERSVDGGAFTQIYTGNMLSSTDAITKGWASVAYRVRAYDAYNDTSGYTTSPTRTVENTVAPTVSSSTSGDMGLKSEDFLWSYAVNQDDSEVTTVVEKIDGVQLRNYTATLGQENTFSVTGQTFMTLLNTSHTMTITATGSSGKSATYTVTFTKGVYSLTVTLDTPLPADALITKMVMNITRSIPEDAEFQVLVTNNANDTTPVWEDITNNVKSGLNHIFENSTVANGNAFNFKISASRGSSNTGGFISTVGGAFE